jgi:hypothetical protein
MVDSAFVLSTTEAVLHEPMAFDHWALLLR